MGLDAIAGDVGELRRELCRGLITALLREEGVAANVGDQEGPDLDIMRGLVRLVVGAFRAGHEQIIRHRAVAWRPPFRWLTFFQLHRSNELPDPLAEGSPSPVTRSR